MTSFDLLAAIDLRGGRVVRLLGGDFEHETAYSDDPAAIGAALVEQGIGWLHVVDLDGAREGRPMHERVVADIVSAVAGRARVELGGGIRGRETARAVLARGVSRIVLGTTAVRAPAQVAAYVAEFGPDRIAVALDVREGRVRAEAWTAEGGAGDIVSAIHALGAQGVSVFEVTAIDRDGSLAGPDLGLLGRAVMATAGSVIASGGIRSLDDLRAVRALGCRGAIVGKAIYEGSLDISAALADLGRAAANGEAQSVT
jgi:phosphoribosylformimino-5-aminoimidazole carboxamide ribotide isomerase